MTDWPALAARFEAATDETVYECVRDLAKAVWRDKRKPYVQMIVTIGGAETWRLPDLLLGVVVACVPAGYWWRADNQPPHRRSDQSHATVSESCSHMDFDGYNARPAAALGAAVCLAWEAVERTDDQNTIKKSAPWPAPPSSSPPPW